MIIDEDIYLEHFGVKGMRWGQRKPRSKAEAEKKKLTSRQKKAIAGVTVGVGLIATAAVLRRSGRTSVSQIPRITDTNPGHRREADRIRADMTRMYRDISTDFRQLERTADARFISDPSAYRWPQSFGA